ncbi:DnaJ C-terminal domain-containing protein [Bifidobacterium sp. UMB6791A]|nr:DnaJ C-terminal domain-containing protein [Bifidobacterium sp. UMB6791B]MDK8248488.1 DnaJ C-terminal domain-containing protein [Bifidobacterium sp. UMB6794B]MDK8635283.1 DnaJ C-terminal domain-containing protein [Bifidobacterium sp. UMB6791A]
MTDYYKILGVDSNASDDEIRKAYRKLSRKYHPDIAGPEFEDKFKEVNAAYDVLSNPEKRKMVDMGVDPNNLSASGAGAGAGAYANMNMDMGDILNQFFSGSFGANAGSPIPRVNRGEDSLTEVKVDLKTVVFGGNAKVHVSTFGLCQDCTGKGSADKSDPITCPDCKGAGFVQRVTRTMFGQMMSSEPCRACEGHGTIIKNVCPNCHGHGRVRTSREVGITIPAGIKDNSRLRLASQGAIGECGGPAGDLYVDVRIRKDEQFTRDLNDLHCWIDVPMSWAVLGHKVDIDTFDGKKSVEIPAGTQNEDTIPLYDLGVTAFGSKDRGNLIVHVLVNIPTKLSEEERSLIEKFANLHDEKVSEVKQHAIAEPVGNKKGFFSKLKDAFC